MSQMNIWFVVLPLPLLLLRRFKYDFASLSSYFITFLCISRSLSHARTRFSSPLIDDRWTDQRLCRFCGCDMNDVREYKCCVVGTSTTQIEIYLYFSTEQQKKGAQNSSFGVCFSFVLCFVSVNFLTTHHKSHTAIINGMLRLKFTWKLKAMRNSF